MSDSKFDNIFDAVDIQYKKDAKLPCEYSAEIIGSFKPELECYVFYKKNKVGELESAVYVTKVYRKKFEDMKALEKIVLDYLHTKTGMQATFKTSGIDEAPLVKHKPNERKKFKET